MFVNRPSSQSTTAPVGSFPRTSLAQATAPRFKSTFFHASCNLGSHLLVGNPQIVGRVNELMIKSMKIPNAHSCDDSPISGGEGTIRSPCALSPNLCPVGQTQPAKNGRAWEKRPCAHLRIPEELKRVNTNDTNDKGISKIYYLVGGIPTPLKNMSSSVGIIIPNWMESHKIPWFQTTNQLWYMSESPSFSDPHCYTPSPRLDVLRNGMVVLLSKIGRFRWGLTGSVDEFKMIKWY